MRLGWLVVAAFAAGTLTGCGAGSPAPEASAEPQAAEKPWVVVEPGNPSASATVKKGGSPRPGLPPVSYLPTASAGCTVPWPQDDRVLIPMVVTPIAGGFKVQWPASYGQTYRLTAVHQGLVAGAQPEPTWQTVQAGTNCTVSATITGLISGDPYIVWLDAPTTPRHLDGSRSLYSGKTGVVHPL
jgi:hypothetical protein